MRGKKSRRERERSSALPHTEIDVQFLNDKDVENLLKMTLSRSKASKRSFRDMWNKGMWPVFQLDLLMKVLYIFFTRYVDVC